MITDGNDVEALLQNYAARQQVIASIESLETISEQADLLTKNIEDFTNTVNNIFQAQNAKIAKNDSEKPLNIFDNDTSTVEKDSTFQSSSSENNNSAQPTSCYISTFTPEYSVFQLGKRGILLHANFNALNMANIKGRCIAYFFYETGEGFKTLDNAYAAPDGQLCYGDYFMPLNANTNFRDFKLFVPYDEFSLAQGSKELKVLMCIYSYSDPQKPTELSRSDFIHFTLSSSTN